MKIVLVQMSMGKEISENLDKSLKYCDMAENCDLVFFPEIQLTPFFPQYHNICVDHYCIDMDNDALVRLCQKAREQLLVCDIDLQEVKKVRSSLDYLSLRRPEQYE